MDWEARGAVVKWLETLCYGAESRWEVVRSRPGFAVPSDEWETLSVSPAVNVYLFEPWTDKAAKGQGLAPPFIPCTPFTVDSNLHYLIRLLVMGNLYLYYRLSMHCSEFGSVPADQVKLTYNRTSVARTLIARLPRLFLTRS